jgi:hypothetical protein
MSSEADDKAAEASAIQAPAGAAKARVQENLRNLDALDYSELAMVCKQEDPPHGVRAVLDAIGHLFGVATEEIPGKLSKGKAGKSKQKHFDSMEERMTGKGEHAACVRQRILSLALNLGDFIPELSRACARAEFSGQVAQL